MRRALQSLFAGRIGKGALSRAWRRMDRVEAWQQRDLPDNWFVRLTLDGTRVKVRLAREATASSLLTARGSAATARRLCWRSGTSVARRKQRSGRCSTTCWRDPARPELVIVHGGRLEAALARVWGDVPPKERNLLADGKRPVSGACSRRA